MLYFLTLLNIYLKNKKVIKIKLKKRKKLLKNKNIYQKIIEITKEFKK